MPTAPELLEELAKKTKESRMRKLKIQEKRYLISYDLKSPNQNYDDVKSAIHEIDSNAQKVLRSQWIVQVDMKAKAICKRVWEEMDSNDKLLVVGLDVQDVCASRNVGLPNSYIKRLELLR